MHTTVAALLDSTPPPAPPTGPPPPDAPTAPPAAGLLPNRTASLVAAGTLGYPTSEGQGALYALLCPPGYYATAVIIGNPTNASELYMQCTSAQSCGSGASPAPGPAPVPSPGDGGHGPARSLIMHVRGDPCRESAGQDTDPGRREAQRAEQHGGQYIEGLGVKYRRRRQRRRLAAGPSGADKWSTVRPELTDWLGTPLDGSVLIGYTNGDLARGAQGSSRPNSTATSVCMGGFGLLSGEMAGRSDPPTQLAFGCTATGELTAPLLGAVAYEGRPRREVVCPTGTRVAGVVGTAVPVGTGDGTHASVLSLTSLTLFCQPCGRR